MKRLGTFLLLFIAYTAAAQNLQWMKRIGSVNNESVVAINRDALGNIYLAGRFSGTVDFDPGPGVFNMASGHAANQDGYICKLSPSGDLIWAKQLAGTLNETITAMRLDAAGNCYISGIFLGAVDFDPGPGTQVLTATVDTPATNGDIFLVKLSSAGAFQWVRTVLAPGADDLDDMDVDAAGNVFAVGRVSGIADIDPGPGTHMVHANIHAHRTFFWKLNTQGQPVWIKVYKGSVLNPIIRVAQNGELLTAGNFAFVFDFSTGSSIDTLRAQSDWDMYLGKLSANGDHIWTRVIAGTRKDDPVKMHGDAAGNVYLAGTIGMNNGTPGAPNFGVTDFDPGPGTHNITTHSPDNFIARYTPAGTLQWVRITGNDAAARLFDLTTDPAGNLYSTGSYYLPIDIDPGPATHYLASIGTSNAYVQSLDTAGRYRLGFRYLSNNITPQGVRVDADGLVYVSGVFTGFNDFDPGVPFLPVTTNGLNDIYVSKFTPGNRINGNVFLDANSDGIRQPSERTIPNLPIRASRDTLTWTGIAVNGSYAVNTDTGNYIVRTNPIPYYVSAPLTHAADFGAAYGQVDTANHFALQPVDTTINDLQITATCLTAIRPGFTGIYRLVAINKGTTTLSGSISFSMDSLLGYLQATPAPTLVQAQMMTWSYTHLAPYDTRVIDIKFQVPVQAALLRWVRSNATIFPVSGDTTAHNNTAQASRQVTGAFDPNEKLVLPNGPITPEYISSGGRLDYTIGFQNTGNDTAFTVVLRDTLSAHLDWNTLEITASSHPYTMTLGKTGALEFRFENILLPDSNRNEPGSHGFVRYLVKPKTVPLGTQIRNQAFIYFDYNEAIPTNQTVNTVSTVTRINPVRAAAFSKAFPNPARTSIRIACAGSFNMVLFDVTGRTVQAMKGLKDAATLPVQGLAKGMYIIVVEKGTKREQHRLVVE